MKINIQKKLKELGFNDNETKVYLSITKLGESSSANIAKKADLPRTTTISILEKLHKKILSLLINTKAQHIIG
jgi:sugar-specific transcriptional regulator TrmB